MKVSAGLCTSIRFIIVLTKWIQLTDFSAISTVKKIHVFLSAVLHTKSFQKRGLT